MQCKQHTYHLKPWRPDENRFKFFKVLKEKTFNQEFYIQQQNYLSKVKEKLRPFPNKQTLSLLRIDHFCCFCFFFCFIYEMLNGIHQTQITKH